MNNYPKLALLFAIPLFALVGIPPLSGFWPKISLFGASYETGQIGLLIAFIFASLLTLFIIAKVWNNVFSKHASQREGLIKLKYFNQFTKREKAAMVFPILLLATITLYFGFFADHIQILSERISYELMHPSEYYEAVFNIKNDSTQ